MGAPPGTTALHQPAWITAYDGADVDLLPWKRFEELVKLSFRLDGWETESTRYFDDGADVIARRNGVSLAIQVKRYRGLVHEAAVDQAIRGLHAYQCTRAVLVTNSSFDVHALSAAHALRVETWDRFELARRLQRLCVLDLEVQSAPPCPECALPTVLRPGFRPDGLDVFRCDLRRGGCGTTVKARIPVLKLRDPNRESVLATTP